MPSRAWRLLLWDVPCGLLQGCLLVMRRRAKDCRAAPDVTLARTTWVTPSSRRMTGAAALEGEPKYAARQDSWRAAPG